MPLISPLYVGLLALLSVGLGLRVSRVRMKCKVSVGDAGNPEMIKAIRVHANSIEYIPLGVVLLVLMELQGAHTWQIHLAGAGFLLARLMHAYGFGRTPQLTAARFWGMILNYGIIALMAVLNIWFALS